MKFKFNPFEFHHLYIGLLLVIAYPLIGQRWPHPSNWYVLIGMAGILLIQDDIWQHLAQGTDPGYRSPVNRAFRWAWGKIFGAWWPFGKL